MFDIQRLAYLLGTQSRTVLCLTISNQKSSYLTYNHCFMTINNLDRFRFE